MVMKRKSRPVATEEAMPAGRFKATCLAVLDDVARSGRALIITKRGRPVARVVPVADPSGKSLLGSATFIGDSVSAVDEVWDAEK